MTHHTFTIRLEDLRWSGRNSVELGVVDELDGWWESREFPYGESGEHKTKEEAVAAAKKIAKEWQTKYPTAKLDPELEETFEEWLANWKDH